MASFTGVGDSVSLTVPAPNEAVSISISGTYNMTILFQRRVGGGNAWETINTYTTANATVADTYYTSNPNGEVLRLIVTVDTSGTATATLTDSSDLTVEEFKDDQGNVLMTFKQSGVLVGASGSQLYLPRVPVTLTAATTLDAENHANRLIILSNSTGFATTLPAATGTGNVYKFLVGTTVSSGTMSIDAAGSDKIAGVSAAVDTTIFTNAGTAVSIDMNGTTTGGLKGTIITLTDAASALWMAEIFQASSGAEATPFATS